MENKMNRLSEQDKTILKRLLDEGGEWKQYAQSVLNTTNKQKCIHQSQHLALVAEYKRWVGVANGYRKGCVANNSDQRTPCTETDEYVLQKLLEAGYGWSKYASSVLGQVERFGGLTERQRATIANMWDKLRSQQHAAEYRARTYTMPRNEWDADISDREAMRSVDYF